MKKLSLLREQDRMRLQYDPTLVGDYAKKSFQHYKAGYTQDTARKTLFPELDHLKRNSKLLDLGCGVGLDIERNIQKGFQVQGFDASKSMVAEAKRRVGNRVKCGDFERTLPWSVGTFDAVYSIFALHYAKRPEIVLKNVARILKRGGYFFAIVSHPFIGYLCSRKKIYGAMEMARVPLFDRKHPVVVLHHTHTFSNFLAEPIFTKFVFEKFVEQDVPSRKFKTVMIDENVPEWFMMVLKKK